MTTFHDVLRNQPSYQADLVFVGLPSADPTAGRIATNGKAIRLDFVLSSQSVATNIEIDVPAMRASMILQPARPARMLLPEHTAYTEIAGGPESSRIVLLPSLGIVFPAYWLEEALAEYPECIDAGHELIDGHPCRKIK